ncbi:hypothetical protein [Kitasatospora sp. GAS204B]|uniref:hypothetical protein n=1 Tax=unclassified Kitasatospora TaxID=2633591 RepID=UPI0024770900|nr:hypothetical protein [Kitasatospora sp. GAS204B]MDH6115803.1 hypothetical protein [Kitasatospora sp. GAS204B]
MHCKWTTVLFSTALVGSVAATTGIAVGTAVDRHPMIKPPMSAPVAPAAPDARRTVAAMGALGGVLERIGDLAAALGPSKDAGPGAANGAVDAATLKGKLRQLGLASDQLKAALPGTPSVPGTPALPGAVQPGGPMQRSAPAMPTASVEEQLTAIQQDAATLVTAASAKQADPATVQSALVPLSTDSLGLSTATIARLTGA